MTHFSMAWRCLFALLLFAGAAHAQGLGDLRPGDSALDSTPIRSGTDSLAVYVVEGEDVIPVGRLILETTVEGDRIRRVEEFIGRLGEVVWRDTFELEDGTLRPINASSTGLREETITFEEQSVRMEAGGGMREAPLGGPVFFANSMDVILASLPLEEGFSATIIALDPESLEEREMPVRVTRAVAVRQAEGAARETWEVHLDLGGAVDVYHIDQTTGELIRFESALDSVVMLRWGRPE